MATMDAPAAERNKDPIWRTMRDFVLPSILEEKQALPHSTIGVLEVAAGAGVHTTYFCHQLEQLISSIDDSHSIPIHWIPTDPDENSRLSIQRRIQDAYVQHFISNRVHIHQPLSLTLNEGGIVEKSILETFPLIDCILCINMIHIAPWEATLGLMKISSDILSHDHASRNGCLCLYGPFLGHGPPVESNMYVEIYFSSPL
jgi:hypothetical protein